MIRYYFSRQPRSVRAVIYDVDAHTFTDSGLSSSSYQLLFPFIDDPQVRAYIKRNCAARTVYLLRCLFCTTRYNELTFSLAIRGYFKMWTNFKYGRIDVAHLSQQIREGRFRRIGFDQDSIDLFRTTAEFVSAQGATFFPTYIPTIDVFNQAEPEKFERSMELLNSLTATNSGVVLLNYNASLQTRHELFFDPIHLNRDGQKEVTSRIAKDLKRFLQEPAIVRIQQDYPLGELRNPPSSGATGKMAQ
jgi:hypothetical protein